MRIRRDDLTTRPDGRSRTRGGACALACLALAVASACSSDDSESAGPQTDPVERTSTTGPVADGADGTVATSDVTVTADESGATTPGPDTSEAVTTTPDADPSGGTAIETSEPDASDDAAPACAELDEVREEDERVELLVDDLLSNTVLSDTTVAEGTFTELANELADDLEAGLPDVVDAYTRAALAAPPGISDDIQILAAGTETLTPLLVDAYRDAADFSEADDRLTGSLSDAEVQNTVTEAGLAALRLDEYTIPECGFQLSNA